MGSAWVNDDFICKRKEESWRRTSWRRQALWVALCYFVSDRPPWKARLICAYVVPTKWVWTCTRSATCSLITPDLLYTPNNIYFVLYTSPDNSPFLFWFTILLFSLIPRQLCLPWAMCCTWRKIKENRLQDPILFCQKTDIRFGWSRNITYTGLRTLNIILFDILVGVVNHRIGMEACTRTYKLAKVAIMKLASNFWFDNCTNYKSALNSTYNLLNILLLYMALFFAGTSTLK